MFRSLGVRLTLAYLLPSLLGLAGLGFYVHRLAARALEEELGRRVMAVASASAATLPAERLSFLQIGDEETRTYGHFRDRLGEMKEATGVHRLAIFGRDERALVDVGGSAHIGDPLPELLRDRLELKSVFAGSPQASQMLFSHEGRTFKTGYAPVRLNNEVVAVVLVEAPADYFAVLTGFRTSLLVLALLSTIGIVGVAFLFARTLTVPIRRLVATAGRIGKGDLLTPIERHPTFELGTLSRALDEMRDGLLARDRQLQLMLAGIAHEVRNPLGGMELLAGVLLEDLAGDEAKASLVRKIRREIEQLERIVNDFLDYAREKPLALEDISARALLSEVAGLLEKKASEKQLRIGILCGEERIVCDVLLLRRALLNLAHNAAFAAPTSSEVVLRCEKAAGAIFLSVQDHGRGIPSGNEEKIFEPFFTTKEKGTGLGLAFVKKIAHAHHGKVRYAPTEGGGATFVIELPLALEPSLG